MSRYARKIDGNQPSVVKELRAAGYSVEITSALGNGFVDLVVGRQCEQCRGLNLLVELKDPAQPPSKRKLTDDETKFHAGWLGPKMVATTAEEIIMAMECCNYGGTS